MIPVWECMTLLYDYSGVPELRQLCGDMFNLLLADLLQESFDGCQGGRARPDLPGQRARLCEMRHDIPLPALCRNRSRCRFGGELRGADLLVPARSGRRGDRGMGTGTAGGDPGAQASAQHLRHAARSGRSTGRSAS